MGLEIVPEAGACTLHRAVCAPEPILVKLANPDEGVIHVQSWHDPSTTVFGISAGLVTPPNVFDGVNLGRNVLHAPKPDGW